MDGGPTGDPAYWAGRQRELPPSQAVGYRTRSAGFNRWMYRARAHTTAALVPMLLEGGLPLEGARILDVGAGRGFFVELWDRLLDRPRIFGVDVSPDAVKWLQWRFPEHDFRVGDASRNEDLPGPLSSFDLVQGYDVLYHLTDDDRFAAALGAMAGRVAPGGHLLVTDNFPRRDLTTRSHVRLRSHDSYLSRLPGFEVVREVPQFVTLNVPSGIGAGWLRWPAVLAWEAVTQLGRWDPAGSLLGGLLYGLDRILLPIVGTRTPSTRILLLRRSDH